MSEYGKSFSLMEILDELTSHCQLITGKKEKIKLILPKKVIENFSLMAKPKERIILYGEVQDPVNWKVSSLYGHGGIVELFNDEDNEVTIKESV